LNLGVEVAVVGARRPRPQIGVSGANSHVCMKADAAIGLNSLFPFLFICQRSTTRSSGTG
jgi:hypothetical protein